MQILKHDLAYIRPQNLLPTAKAEEFIGRLEAQPEQQETVVIGDTASGKLTMTKEFAARSGRPAVVHSRSAMDPSDVEGRYVSQGADFIFQESLMKSTAEAGGIVVIDSPTLMSADVQNQVADMVTQNPAAKFIAVMDTQEVENGLLTGKFVNAFLGEDPGQKVEL